MNKQAKYYRKGHRIIDADTLKTVDEFIDKRNYRTLINKAKRRSRELQLTADKALGRGTVQLIGEGRAV